MPHARKEAYGTLGRIQVTFRYCKVALQQTRPRTHTKIFLIVVKFVFQVALLNYWAARPLRRRRLQNEPAANKPIAKEMRDAEKQEVEEKRRQKLAMASATATAKSAGLWS